MWSALGAAVATELSGIRRRRPPLRHRAPPPAPRLVEGDRRHPRRERVQLLAALRSHPRSHQRLLHRILGGGVAPGRKGHGVHHARVVARQEPADLGFVRRASLRWILAWGALTVTDRRTHPGPRSVVIARSFLGREPGRGTLRSRCRPPVPSPVSWPAPAPFEGLPARLRLLRGTGHDPVPRRARDRARGGPSLDPADRHGRSAMGHPLVDAGGPAFARRARRDVLRVVHDELALLSEPRVDPHRPVPAYDGGVPARPSRTAASSRSTTRRRSPPRCAPAAIAPGSSGSTSTRTNPTRSRATCRRAGTAGWRSCTPNTSTTA